MEDCEKNERIICAATKHGDHIIAGSYHGQCLQIAKAAGLDKATDQGFLTTRNRYVDRYEALSIAGKENQIIKKHPPRDQLLSEDLKLWQEGALDKLRQRIFDQDELLHRACQLVKEYEASMKPCPCDIMGGTFCAAGQLLIDIETRQRD